MYFSTRRNIQREPVSKARIRVADVSKGGACHDRKCQADSRKRAVVAGSTRRALWLEMSLSTADEGLP
jgi:hypothetical protein